MRNRIVMRALAVLLPALAAGGCELREVTLAEPRDIVVAEVMLRAGERVQTAYLHRTTGLHGSARVFDAVITVVEDGTGRTLEFDAAADSLCLAETSVRPSSNVGTCYVAVGSADAVRPGTRYNLSIALPGDRRITGSTVVPGDFRLLQPSVAEERPGAPVPVCRLDPGTVLEMTWSHSTSAWAYIGEARLLGLLEALRAAGEQVPAQEKEYVQLVGVAVGGADTTMTFPGQFGLFDRFDDTLLPVLLAIREGLPPGVLSEVAVASADRNYVNWVRGGNFNPSGLVRVPSVTGDGTGVFGALVIRRVQLATPAPGEAPPPTCARE